MTEKNWREILFSGALTAAVIQPNNRALGRDGVIIPNSDDPAVSHSFATKLAAEQAVIPSNLSAICTLGYYAAGDGGGAIYKRINAKPQHALWFQSLDGALWQWADRILNVFMAGARDDGTYNKATGVMTGTDNTRSIQNAIDAHTYFHLSDSVYFPIHNTGMYRTTGTIHCGYGVSFTTTRIFGAGPALRGESQFNGPTILCDFSNAMGVNHQGARGNIWRGVSLIGRNWAYCYENNMGDVGGARIDDTIASNWLNPTLEVNSGSRYAPYAAFCIDGYSGAQPTPHYPEVSFPSWLGNVGQYSKVFSSDVTIQDFYVGGFSVGILAHPSGSDGNGDFITIAHGLIEYTQYCISISHTQCRNVRRDNLIYNGNYCILTNNTHGKRNGAIIGPDINGSASGCTNLFQLGGTSTGGPLIFISMYCEACWRIGDVNSPTSSETSIHFDSCKFAFTGQNDTRGVPPFLIGGEGNQLPIKFTGGAIFNLPSVAAISYSGTFVSFDGTTIHSASERTSLYERFAHNVTCGGLCLRGLTSRTGAIQVKSAIYNIDTGILASQISGARQRCNRSFPANFYSARLVEYYEDDGEGVWNPRSTTSLDKSKLLDMNISGKLLTFMMPPEYAAWQFALVGPNPGDVLMDEETGTVWFVHNVDNNARTVKATLQNNYRSDQSGGYTMLAPINLRSGTLFCGNSRLFTTGYCTVGDLTSGSRTIANVGRADGYGAYLPTDLRAGDLLYIDQHRDFAFSETSATISEVVPGMPGSLRVASAAKYTQTRKRLTTFVRPGAPNTN